MRTQAEVEQALREADELLMQASMQKNATRTLFRGQKGEGGEVLVEAAPAVRSVEEEEAGRRLCLFVRRGGGGG